MVAGTGTGRVNSRGRRRVVRHLAIGMAAALWPAFVGAAPSDRPRRVVLQREFGRKIRERIAGWFAEEGYAEGREVILEYVDLERPDPAENERRARAVVESRPDAIVVPGGETIALFRRLTTRVPVVFWSFGVDPVKAGLVESYHRPGGNITGTTNMGTERIGKTWEILRALRPDARRFGALWTDARLSQPLAQHTRAICREVAARMGVENVEVVVPASAGFPEVEKAIRASGAQVLTVFFGLSRPTLVELTGFLERSRIPSGWETLDAVRQGGLLYHMGSLEEAFREAVRMVARILRGANPAQIPIQEVTRFELAINLRTARAMGLVIPDAIRLQATQVFD